MRTVCRCCGEESEAGMDDIVTKRTYTVEIVYTSRIGAPYTQDRLSLLTDTMQALIASALPNADSVRVTEFKIEPAFPTSEVML